MKSLAWAEDEFGGVDLGDARRTWRLVRMAQRVAEHPAGTVTGVFSVPREREGAYRLLSNKDVELENVRRSIEDATVRKCRGEAFVFIAEDGSSLAFTDEHASKGTGPVGALERGGRGLQVVTAIAIDQRGIPLGICGSLTWARAEGGVTKDRQNRVFAERETAHWATVTEQVTDAFKRAESAVRPWFVMDRGADAWELLLPLHEQNIWFTVRSCHDRRVEVPKGEPRRYLSGALEDAPIDGYFQLNVPARTGRKARVANMHIRAKFVHLRLQTQAGRPKGTMPIWVVHTMEEGTVPAGAAPLEWRLLTNRPVTTLDDAILVIQGYTRRWRIEEFHRAWKSASEETEDSQLRSRGGLDLWSLLHAAAAMRLLRMTYLSRNHPDLPASDEFSAVEVEAAYIIARKISPPPPNPTIADVVACIALAGGYTGKSSGGPPGLQILARGWRRIEPAAELLAFQRG